MELIQNKNDKEPCRLRNAGGSECGTCSCFKSMDCSNPPLFTAMQLMMAHLIDQKQIQL